MTALTRAVSPTLAACELTWRPRERIDITKAIEQHDAYERALAELGLHVISLPAEPDLPDATFVEDPLVVVDEVAIVTRLGAASRRPESESLAAVLEAGSSLTRRQISQEQRLLTMERNRLVHAALRSLPESLRSVLLWQFFDERSLEEIAAQLNRPVATVKSRRHRARLELRKRFAKRLQTTDLSMALS